MAGKLYIVSTPIGNLGDMTKRAMEVSSGGRLYCCRGYPAHAGPAKQPWHWGEAFKLP